jgi:hypothetical protein
MGTLSRFLFAFFLAAPITASAAPATQPASPAIPSEHRLTFDFHSGFLMNLHHFLFNLATRQQELDQMRWPVAPTAAEMTTLRAAVAFYHDNYAQRDLLFDDVMGSIKTALSVDDALRSPRTLPLPPPLIAILDSVAPIYARCIWAEQDLRNQAWIRDVKLLDSRYGAEIQRDAEHYLASPFPRTPVRIDLVVETGKRQGAYTDVQAVLPSGRANYQGLASLEMLYHEAAHVESTAKLEQAIEAQLKQTHRDPDSELWHALQFYTVGTIVKDVLKRRGGLGYEPYADKVGLFKAPWSQFVPLIEGDWRPYMDGRERFDEAIAHMVDKLPRQSTRH